MTIENFSTEVWETGSDDPANTIGTVASGQTLAARTPLGQNSTTGEFHEWNPAANDGTEKAVRLTAFAIDTTGGAQDKQLIKSGTFNPDLVNWPGTPTDAQKKVAFVGSPISLQTPR